MFVMGCRANGVGNALSQTWNRRPVLREGWYMSLTVALCEGPW